MVFILIWSVFVTFFLPSIVEITVLRVGEAPGENVLAQPCLWNKNYLKLLNRFSVYCSVVCTTDLNT